MHIWWDLSRNRAWISGVCICLWEDDLKLCPTKHHRPTITVTITVTTHKNNKFVVSCSITFHRFWVLLKKKKTSFKHSLLIFKFIAPWLELCWKITTSLTLCLLIYLLVWKKAFRTISTLMYVVMLQGSRNNFWDHWHPSIKKTYLFGEMHAPPFFITLIFSFHFNGEDFSFHLKISLYTYKLICFCLWNHEICAVFQIWCVLLFHVNNSWINPYDMKETINQWVTFDMIW